MNTVLVVTTEGDIAEESLPADSLSFLQEQVHGLVDVVRLPGGIDMWVNDEGMFTLEANLLATQLATLLLGEWRQRFHGPAVFTSSDNEGRTVPLSEDQRDLILSALLILTRG